MDETVFVDVRQVHGAAPIVSVATPLNRVRMLAALATLPRFVFEEVAAAIIDSTYRVPVWINEDERQAALQLRKDTLAAIGRT